MKRSSIQLNTKDDKQDKNLTKRSESNVFHITSFLKNCHWVQNNAQTPSKTGSQPPLSVTVPLYRNF